MLLYRYTARALSVSATNNVKLNWIVLLCILDEKTKLENKGNVFTSAAFSIYLYCCWRSVSMWKSTLKEMVVLLILKLKPKLLKKRCQQYFMIKSLKVVVKSDVLTKNEWLNVRFHQKKVTVTAKISKVLKLSKGNLETSLQNNLEKHDQKI